MFIKNPKKARLLAKGALLAAVMIPVAAHAQMAVFVIEGAEGIIPSSVTQSNGPVSITYFNPSGAAGFGNSHGNLPVSLNSAGNGLDGFQFKFNVPVEVTSYSLGSSTGSTIGATFELDGPNGDSLANTLATSGAQMINGVFILQANEVATLNSNFPQTGSVKFDSITVTTAVPVSEPGAWAVIAGFGSLLLAWARRRVFPKNSA